MSKYRISSVGAGYSVVEITDKGAKQVFHSYDRLKAIAKRDELIRSTKKKGN